MIGERIKCYCGVGAEYAIEARQQEETRNDQSLVPCPAPRVVAAPMAPLMDDKQPLWHHPAGVKRRRGLVANAAIDADHRSVCAGRRRRYSGSAAGRGNWPRSEDFR